MGLPGKWADELECLERCYSARVRLVSIRAALSSQRWNPLADPLSLGALGWLLPWTWPPAWSRGRLEGRPKGGLSWSQGTGLRRWSQLAVPVLWLPNGRLLIGRMWLYSNYCRTAWFESHSKFNFKTSQCFVIAMRAVQRRDQPATAGADVSFPDRLSQHRRWSDRVGLLGFF